MSVEGEIAGGGKQPRISVLMPVWNTRPDVLDEAIRSVLDQSHPDWELCIADDRSTRRATLHVLDRYRGADPRVKIVTAPEPLHIARATNLAAAFATGEFVGFLDHDDLLTPDALERMAAAAAAHPCADLLYSDEDKLEPDGRFTEPYLKPDWSPELLFSVPYILHFTMIRKSLFLKLGGLRHAFTGAQDYDLALRAGGRARAIVHVPHVLYHWRKVPGSAAAEVAAKPDALAAAARAVAAQVHEADAAAQVRPGLFPGSFRVDWPVDPAWPVTLVMPTAAARREVPGRGDILLVENAARSIHERSTFRNYELLVLDDGRLDAGAQARLAAIGARVEQYDATPGPFNFAAKINEALRRVETEDVILLNDDIEVIAPDWMEAMLGQSRRPEVGAVGARLLYPNDRVQHAGMILGVHGASTHIFHGQPRDDHGYYGYAHVIRNYSAVTAAVMATRRSLWRALGGFDPAYRVDFNDTDYCLRLGEAGYRIVYTPHALLYHLEGGSLARTRQDPAEVARFTARWGDRIARDPFYHPLLPRDRTDCAVTRW